MSSFEEQQINVLKMQVQRLETQVEFLYKHLGVTFVAETRAEDDPRVIAALKANNLLEAIRLYRETNDIGPVDARSAVEEMKKRLGI